MIKEQLGNISLYNCDCMDFMANCKDNEFDLAIVDPEYRDINQPTKDMRNNGGLKKWKGKPTKSYFNELYRISKEQIIWGANNFQLPPFKGFVIYKKLTISEVFTMSMAEIASLSEGLGTISKLFECVPQKKNRIHPTQKPIKLYEWLLLKYAKPGQKIFDSHFGSLSIGIACHNLGYELTACEKDKEYYDAAKKRLQIHQMQLSLFK